ncbi:hypothetical protein [Comamonas endophytica]|uniref:Uncharacterized protein n=1 Tax=Comamonas endophytica TaxID=2949090 RepID=A0ABY6GB04_9BURK|nr:hypothetical protein [Acidovorax sp. 5MLIR]UYG52244.1 hypothetical protein M9799_03115 [Acidovorax sp. 5MLIR]
MKSLLPAAAVLVFSTGALAQDATAIANPLGGSKPAEDKVVRYSAGDSIPLGYFVPARKIPDQPGEMPAQPNELPSQTGTGRYSAGESIVLGTAQAVPAGKPVAAAVVAGSSVTTSPVAGSPVSGPVETQSPPQSKAAWFSDATHLPLAGALADSVTTNIGLNQPGLAEKNGLINTSPAGLVGLFVIKAGIIYYFDHQKPAIRKSGLKATAGVWNGVAMNNLLLIAGASNPISLIGGALFGVFMYQRQGQILEKEELAKNAQ